MPRLLGSFHYKVHFGGFEGSVGDLRAKLESEKGSSDLYEGADLTAVSEALRGIYAASAAEQYHGAKIMLDVPGAGVAIVSGLMQLCHPTKYAIINKASLAPFGKTGRLSLSSQQRTAALEEARSRLRDIADPKDRVLGEIFRWQELMAEVLQVCELADFHVLDQFIWTMEGGEYLNPAERMRPILDMLPAEEENVKVRADAEKKARSLIESNLGTMSEAQFSELFELLNTCVGKSGVVYTRFAPAFVGKNANLLIERTVELNAWIPKLWKASDDELKTLLTQFWEERFMGGGRSLPTAILYLRDKEKFAVWMSSLENALYSVVNGLPAKIRTGFSYLQYCERLQRLRKSLGFPPELHDWILFKLMTKEPTGGEKLGSTTTGQFAGFSSDAFQFLADLSDNNNTDWFQTNKERFQQVLEQPLRFLFKDLGDEVITSLDPTLETTPNTKKCLSRINKNTYGKPDVEPYNKSLWGAFYRKRLTKQTDCQLYIAVRSQTLSFGLFLGEEAEEVRQSLIQRMEENPDLAQRTFAQLLESGFLFVPETTGEKMPHVDIGNYEQFLEFVKGCHFNVCRILAPEEAVSAGVSLKARIANDFRLLYPLFLLATSDDPRTEVTRYLEIESHDGEDDASEKITIADVAAATYMEEAFFQKLDRYLKDKQQLIFFGPPGTGKTFVALKYAEYLTQDKSKVRTVQFHPSYGYEDFLEGLRPVTRNGQLAYEVQSGIFKSLCDEARADLKNQYVLIIDEINRGNLPRILGELLFLLERREETTMLPYSKKQFSIPRNVVVIGTMNSSDRSIALMDLALRRRFHFVMMEPRKEVLAAWLKQQNKPQWIESVFSQLNEALRAEKIEEDRYVGHAHFMSHQLNEEHLELIWEGTVEPLLKEYFFTAPELLEKFRLDNFLSSCAETIAEQEISVDVGDSSENLEGFDSAEVQA
ncbi:DUF2461 family protein [Blastopirellula marina]|nr:DUF2461 family protein [Blastopirellula marina]